MGFCLYTYDCFHFPSGEGEDFKTYFTLSVPHYLCVIYIFSLSQHFTPSLVPFSFLSLIVIAVIDIDCQPSSNWNSLTPSPTHLLTYSDTHSKTKPDTSSTTHSRQKESWGYHQKHTHTFLNTILGVILKALNYSTTNTFHFSYFKVTELLE